MLLEMTATHSLQIFLSDVFMVPHGMVISPGQFSSHCFLLWAPDIACYSRRAQEQLSFSVYFALRDPTFVGEI